MSLTKSDNISAAIDAENKSTWKIARNNPSLALEQAKATLEKAKEANYKLGIAWAIGNIGAAEMWQSNYEEALNHTSQAR